MLGGSRIGGCLYIGHYTFSISLNIVWGFLLCYTGERLGDDSESVSRALSGWIMFNLGGCTSVNELTGVLGPLRRTRLPSRVS